MADSSVYHDGMRRLQDQFDSRRIADRLEQVTYATEIDERDRRFIESVSMFFLATADPSGQPDCSYKGGMPGFVRVLDPVTIAWPDYDGNGQFRSMGNLLVNPRVGLLFIDWQRPSRMRVNGIASVSTDDPLAPTWEGAQMVVRVKVEQVFPNCARYIHRMQPLDTSVYAPRAGHECPRPGWKDDPEFADALPEKDLRPPE
jgi:predicted pyridoxine 5'-phosphate oxidase superfamily flavin-nucleotide-binding protein